MRYVVSSASAVAALFVSAWVAASAPINPALQNPPNLATNVPANVVLTWAPGDAELIVNGGFETGNFTGWARLNINGGGGGGGGGGNPNDTYINNGGFIPTDGDGPHAPYAGRFSTLTDQNGPGTIILYQDVTIPANATAVTLTWADMIRNQFNTFVATQPPQEYRVEIRRPDNSVLGIAFRTEPGDPTITDWQKRSFSLDAYRGQTIRIAFIEEQFWNFFNLHLDNISVRLRDPGPFTYHVYFGLTNLLTANDFVGTTTNGSWSLPQLNPQTTYFWRLIAQQGSLQVTGPVWRFTTAPVGPLDHFTWDNIPSPQVSGAPLSARIVAHDAANNVVTNFAGPVNLSASSMSASTPGTILDSANPTSFAAFDRSTVAYSFTPNTDLLVTAVRHFSGRKVSLWTDAGGLLASALVSGNPGAWRETPITPVQLFAGQTYRIGLYSPLYDTNYLRLDGAGVFAHGTLEASYEVQGDAFPTNLHSARWWLVDLVYSVPALEPIPITPNTADGFVNGVWIGSLAVNSSNAVLRAEDQNGHVGLSGLISFIDDFDLDGMPDNWESAHGLDPRNAGDAVTDLDADGATNLAEYRAGTDPQSAASALRMLSVQRAGSQVILRVLTVPGKTYSLESSATLMAGSWQVLRDDIAGGTEEIVLADVAVPQNFFRLQVR